MKALLISCIGLLLGCQSTNEVISTSTSPVVFPKSICAASLVFDRQAVQQKGIIGYRQDVGMYFINVYVGGIDSSVSGLVCNMPDAFKNAGKKVLFDGDYFTDAKLPSPQLGGETMRYLTLSSIKVEP